MVISTVSLCLFCGEVHEQSDAFDGSVCGHVHQPPLFPLDLSVKEQSRQRPPTIEELMIRTG